MRGEFLGYTRLSMRSQASRVTDGCALMREGTITVLLLPNLYNRDVVENRRRIPLGIQIILGLGQWSRSCPGLV